GVTFNSLRAVLEDKAEAGSIAQLPVIERDVIAALANAFATDGAILTVSAGARLEKPIHLIFLGSDGSLAALQNIIRVGGGANVSIIETHAGLGNAQALSLTRLAIGAGAALKHVRVNTGGGAKHLASAAVALDEGAQYDPLQVTVDAALTRAQAS